MGRQMANKKWYVVNVEVLGDQDVSAADVQAFVQDLADKLTQGQMKVQKDKPADAPTTEGTAGVVPLYVCHVK